MHGAVNTRNSCNKITWKINGIFAAYGLLQNYFGMLKCITILEAGSLQFI